MRCCLVRERPTCSPRICSDEWGFFLLALSCLNLFHLRSSKRLLEQSHVLLPCTAVWKDFTFLPALSHMVFTPLCAPQLTPCEKLFHFPGQGALPGSRLSGLFSPLQAASSMGAHLGSEQTVFAISELLHEMAGWFCCSARGSRCSSRVPGTKPYP